MFASSSANRPAGHPALLTSRAIQSLPVVSKRQAARILTQQAPTEKGVAAGEKDEDLMSEKERKRAEADRLRAMEKFTNISLGEATCLSCGYEYDPKMGDPEYPVAKGVKFEELPSDWICPVCNNGQQAFKVKTREVAGFADNLTYGFGTNSWTSGQKNMVIWSGFASVFLLFMAGYGMQ